MSDRSVTYIQLLTAVAVIVLALAVWQNGKDDAVRQEIFDMKVRQYREDVEILKQRL